MGGGQAVPLPCLSPFHRSLRPQRKLQQRTQPSRPFLTSRKPSNLQPPSTHAPAPRGRARAAAARMRSLAVAGNRQDARAPRRGLSRRRGRSPGRGGVQTPRALSVSPRPLRVFLRKQSPRTFSPCNCCLSFAVLCCVPRLGRGPRCVLGLWWGSPEWPF